jgi:hypothetical protein
MSSRLVASLALVILIGLAAIAAIAAIPQQPLAQRLGETPVIVELFTSQGCSSCPPADAIIESIAKDESLRGRVIPLAFHVDYWDRLGWRDPFSSRSWTQRQMVYVHALGVNSAYTPQAVVGGRRQFVGANGSAMDAAIVEASHVPRTGTISVEAKRDGANVNATIHADDGGDADVMIALVEFGVTTNIGGGENHGRTLRNDAIVRDMQHVRSGAHTVSMKTDPAWHELGVVVFLQNRKTMAITNAAMTKL